MTAVPIVTAKEARERSNQNIPQTEDLRRHLTLAFMCIKEATDQGVYQTQFHSSEIPDGLMGALTDKGFTVTQDNGMVTIQW